VPPHVVSATSGGPNAYTLTGITLTFDRAINPATLTPDDLGLVGPGGQQIAVSSVKPTGSADKTFTVSFATQTTAGTYTLYVGSNAADTNGNKVASYQATFKLTAAPVPPHVVSAAGSGPNAYSLSSVTLTFDRAINPATLTPGDLGLYGPGGQQVSIASVKPTDSADKTFTVSFATQTKAGSYTLYVGTNAMDMAGDRLAGYQSSFRVVQAPPPTTPPFTGGTFTSTTQGAIQTGGRAVSLLTISQAGLIGSVRVTVNIKYPQVGDLYIHLQGPDGTDIVLFSQAGSQSANLLNTTFSDSASNSINFSAGPYSNASYQPVRPLSALAGKQLSGTWKLWVEDRGTGSASGTLVSWSLGVTTK
jgi:subtilisin-like proprotein convertase family protein/methionine-rich copper-binding protein CopC